MNRILVFLTVLIAVGASTAGAVPIPFDSVQFDLLGSADVTDGAGGAIASDSFGVAAPPTALPVLADANATSPNGGSAFAFAGAEAGFLAVGTEALATADEGADALVSAAFSGGFTSPGGTLLLRLDFDFSQVLTGSGSVELVFGIAGFLAPESLLFDTSGGNSFTLLRLFSPTAGTTATLDLLLTASGNGGAQNLANLGFRIDTVPEPATLLIFLPGLGLLGAVRRRAGS